MTSSLQKLKQHVRLLMKTVIIFHIVNYAVRFFILLLCWIKKFTSIFIMLIRSVDRRSVEKEMTKISLCMFLQRSPETEIYQLIFCRHSLNFYFFLKIVNTGLHPQSQQVILSHSSFLKPANNSDCQGNGEGLSMNYSKACIISTAFKLNPRMCKLGNYS